MIPGIVAGRPVIGGGGGGGDPYWANVVSLLNFNTDLTDNKGKTWTASGDAHVSGGQLVLDGSGDWIQTPNATDWDFGSGDFCVEGVIETSSSGNQVFIGKRNPGGYAPFGIGLFSGKLQILMSTTGTSWASIAADANNFPLNTQQHVALTRNGTTVRLCREGVVVASDTVAGALAVNTNQVEMGTWGSQFRMTGKVNAFRATKGVARYTGAYTPPTLPFPNS